MNICALVGFIQGLLTSNWGPAALDGNTGLAWFAQLCGL